MGMYDPSTEHIVYVLRSEPLSLEVAALVGAAGAKIDRKGADHEVGAYA
jgi:hypothetical protein